MACGETSALLVDGPRAAVHWPKFIGSPVNKDGRCAGSLSRSIAYDDEALAEWRDHRRASRMQGPRT
jgi:hypothetical protein